MVNPELSKTTVTFSLTYIHIHQFISAYQWGSFKRVDQHCETVQGNLRTDLRSISISEGFPNMLDSHLKKRLFYWWSHLLCTNPLKAFSIDLLTIFHRTTLIWTRELLEGRKYIFLRHYYLHISTGYELGQ